MLSIKFQRIALDSSAEDIVYQLNDIIDQLNSLVARIDKLENNANAGGK